LACPCIFYGRTGTGTGINARIGTDSRRQAKHIALPGKEFAMIQLLYGNKLYLYGKADEITKHLKELAVQFKTVKDLLDFHKKKLQDHN
jgi:hypothetical protein